MLYTYTYIHDIFLYIRKYVFLAKFYINIIVQYMFSHINFKCILVFVYTIFCSGILNLNCYTGIKKAYIIYTYIFLKCNSTSNYILFLEFKLL